MRTLKCFFVLTGTTLISAQTIAAVTLETPVLLSPSATITSEKPTYKWQPVAGGTAYKLVIRNNAGIIFSKKYKPNEVGCTNEIDICRITPAVALAQGSYVWKLNGINAQGSGPQASMKFRRGKPLKPETLAPVANITTATPAYSWKAVSSAGKYNLSVADSTGAIVLNQWLSANDIGCPSEADTCSVKPPDALKYVAHNWKVRARNPLGNGPWSTVKSFINTAMCNVQLLSDNTTGGCHVRLVEPANCEEIDLSGGKEYLLGWTTDGSYCETPWTFYIAGNPANLNTGENIYWQQFSTDVNAGITHTGGLIRLSAAALDSLGLTSDNGIYHWLIVSWYGSHPASQTFRIKR